MLLRIFIGSYGMSSAYTLLLLTVLTVTATTHLSSPDGILHSMNTTCVFVAIGCNHSATASIACQQRACAVCTKMSCWIYYSHVIGFRFDGVLRQGNHTHFCSGSGSGSSSAGSGSGSGSLGLNSPEFGHLSLISSLKTDASSSMSYSRSSCRSSSSL